MTNFFSGDIINVYAKPKSSMSKLVYDNDINCFIAYLTSIPDDNKANEELVKLFKKQLKIKVELVKGFKSKNKKVKVL